MTGPPSEPTAYDKIMNFIKERIVSSIDETQRLLPDSILFGSLILYALTHNLSFGVFSIFLVESSLLHKLIDIIFSKAVGGSTPAKSLKCIPGFRSSKIDFESILTKFNRQSGTLLPGHGYPSFGIFTIASMAAYIGSAMTVFKETMTTMGSEWNMRYNLAIGFILAFLVIFVLTRYIRSCDSGGGIATALLFGVIIGVGLFYLNKMLFGPESMNFLGLPFLVSKTAGGGPIYVCTPATPGK